MGAPAKALAENMLRLFPDHDPQLLAAHRNRPFLIARLLEEGDREDLSSLLSLADEDELRAWLKTRGYRSLSRRSRLFWEWILSVESGPQAGIREEIWPL